MRRERHAKLQAAMAEQGLDALVLLTSGNVLYSTGVRSVLTDTARTYQQRAIGVVVAGAPFPFLFSPFPDGAPPSCRPTTSSPRCGPRPTRASRTWGAG